MVATVSLSVPPILAGKNTAKSECRQEVAMLTDVAVRNAKPKRKPFKLADERALYLLVMPTGGKLWRLDYRFGDKRKTISLGSYPDVSLARAREKRDEARRLLADGIDPLAQRKTDKVATAETFRTVTEEFLAQRKPIWAANHFDKVKARLEWLYPYIGDRPIGAVQAAELLGPLRAIEAAGKGETAVRTRLVAGQVFRYAIAAGKAQHDPTVALRGALAPVKPGHHAAVTEPKAFGALLRAIDGYAGEPVSCAALKLLPLVFVRPGELRLAEWAEFDLDDATWAIPGRRMKTGTDHIVPLSTQAVAILRALHPLTGNRQLVFPSLRSRGRPISENTLNAALRRLGYAKDAMTGHGFRASARTMLDEVLGVRVELIEHQLAHAVRDPLGRAYNRTAHLAERRAMMQKWADYCDGLKAGAEVVSLQGRGRRG
jgi:integrase